MDLDQAEGFEDQPGLTWAADFDGARPSLTRFSLVARDVELDVPETGGSVRAVVSAGPPDVYRVVDAYCLDSVHSLIPSMHQGQSLEFAFDAIPDGRSWYGCYFTFDSALLPDRRPSHTAGATPHRRRCRFQRA